MHDLTRITLTPAVCEHLAKLLEDLRPDWPAHITQSILTSHPHAQAVAVTIASVRAAANPDYEHPRSIMWRGPHWSGLEADAPGAPPRGERCDVCDLPADRCVAVPSRISGHVYTRKVEVPERNVWRHTDAG